MRGRGSRKKARRKPLPDLEVVVNGGGQAQARVFAEQPSSVLGVNATRAESRHPI